MRIVVIAPQVRQAAAEYRSDQLEVALCGEPALNQHRVCRHTLRGGDRQGVRAVPREGRARITPELEELLRNHLRRPQADHLRLPGEPKLLSIIVGVSNAGGPTLVPKTVGRLQG
jgi:hypothetical protein